MTLALKLELSFFALRGIVRAMRPIVQWRVHKHSKETESGFQTRAKKLLPQSMFPI